MTLRKQGALWSCVLCVLYELSQHKVARTCLPIFLVDARLEFMIGANSAESHLTAYHLPSAQEDGCGTTSGSELFISAAGSGNAILFSFSHLKLKPKVFCVVDILTNDRASHSCFASSGVDQSIGNSAHLSGFS